MKILRENHNRTILRRALNRLSETANRLKPYTPLLLAPLAPLGMVYMVAAPEIKEQDAKLLTASSHREIDEVLEVYRSNTAAESVKNRIILAQRLRGLYWLKDRLMRGEELPASIAIPDLHAQAAALARIMIELDKFPGERIFMGDYFDRRAGNLQVFERLRSEKNILWGNHEIFLLFTLKGDVQAFADWLANGGMPFLQECGMDCSDLARQYGKWVMSLPEKECSPKKVWEKVFATNIPLVNRTLDKVMRNPDLKHIFDWLVESGRLYHLDEQGMLYIHGGAPLVEADPEIFARLDAWGAEAKRMLSLKRSSRTDLRRIKFNLSRFLEVRDDQIMFPLLIKGNEAIRSYLKKMGIMGIVYAHSYREQVQMFNRRIFAIDLGMASYEQGSFLAIGPQGAISFKEGNAGQFSERQLLSSADWKEIQKGEIDFLIESVKNYFAFKFPPT